MGWIRRLSMVAAAWGITLSCALAQDTVQHADPQPAPAASPGNCTKDIAIARLGAPSTYVVQLDSDTLWRPRGAEVRFTMGGTSGSPPQVKRVLACFRWELAHQVPGYAGSDYTPSPLIRSVPNAAGLIEYGALVPELPDANRWGNAPNGAGAVQYTAVYTVPVADMQVLVELIDGSWFAVVLPVGITNVPTALIVLSGFALIAGIILWRWAPMTLFDGAPLPTGVSRWLGTASRHVLAVISTCNGVASLSQFQIMLWTLVVGGAAIYVMVLSGNLIAISSGTLTLLGIAGGTSVLARIAPTATSTTNAEVIAQATPASATPHWSQMLIDDAADPEIDVTRVQMLIFTLITAAFVTIKVAVSYSIPEIPDNFLVLMGISNGVYLAGRHIPSTPKGTTP
jgi:hypothetical protein